MDHVSSTHDVSPATTAVPAAPRWLDEREQAAWRGMLQMYQQVMARLNRNLVVESGLSEGDYAILVSLSEAPEGHLRAFELARWLLWEKSRLSHQLTRMERRGLVRREECPSDARGAFVVITEAGRTAIEAAAPRHVEDVRHWFLDALSPQQLDALSDVATTVLSRLEADGDGCPEALAACTGEEQD
jgi:DNA-binding MarR family transcriptional regulator